MPLTGGQLASWEMGVAVIVSAIHSSTLFNFDLFTNTQKMGLRDPFCRSHKCFFLFSLLSCPAILPPYSSCQFPLRKMLNLAGDSSARTVLPWPLGWLLARQSGSRALLGLQGDQANTAEMTGLKPPARTASLSGKDPQVFSCHPSGDTIPKGEMFTSPVGAWSVFWESLREEADKNPVSRARWGRAPSRDPQLLILHKRKELCFYSWEWWLYLSKFENKQVSYKIMLNICQIPLSYHLKRAEILLQTSHMGFLHRVCPVFTS